jgi:murein DD-endopeptidase MepM/ murein hydrolase activator NlpD
MNVNRSKGLKTIFFGLAVVGSGLGFGLTIGCSSARLKSEVREHRNSGSQELSGDSLLPQLMANETDEHSSYDGPSIPSSSGTTRPENSAATFQWPVDSARLSRGFRTSGRKPHLGIDLAAPKGTPILAAHDGVVIYTGREFKGFGKMVMIEGGKGWATLYAHFSKITAREGQRVSRGDKIGEMGRTGHATGNHLHFEVRKESGPVDPLEYLPNGATIAKLVDKRRRPSSN